MMWADVSASVRQNVMFLLDVFTYFMYSVPFRGGSMVFIYFTHYMFVT